MKKLLLTFLMVGGIAVANPPAQGSDTELRKGLWAIEPDSTLPNVLLLGDSISIGYTLGVRKGLEGKANVFRPVKVVGKRYRPENCEGTTLGVKKIDRWLAQREEWDVIHFNWGLHDLKHVHPESKKNSTWLCRKLSQAKES